MGAYKRCVALKRPLPTQLSLTCSVKLEAIAQSSGNLRKCFGKLFLKVSVTVTFRKAWAARWYLQASKEIEPVGLKMLSPTLGVLVRTIYEISGYPEQQPYELSATYCHGPFYNCTKCRQLKWTNSTSLFSSHFYPGYFSLLWSRNPLPPKNLELICCWEVACLRVG